MGFRTDPSTFLGRQILCMLALLLRCCPQIILLAFSGKLQPCASWNRVQGRGRVVVVVGDLVGLAAITNTTHWWLKQQTFISHSSRGWKAKIRVLADSVSGESQLPILLFPHMAETISLVLRLIRALISSRGFHPHDLILFQRPYLQIPSLWGLRLQHMMFRGTQTCSPWQRVNSLKVSWYW